MTDRMCDHVWPIKEPWVVDVFPGYYGGMSLTKIPFILLATWGIHITYKQPNPPPPQHELFTSSVRLRVPLENSRFIQWAPIIARVSNYSEDILAEKLTKDPRLGLAIHCLRCWDINYPGICESFIASIQNNIVAARLEGRQVRKPLHVKRRCNRIDFNRFGNMDKVDDLPSPGSIFPVRGQYSEGPQTYCLWSIFYRSSSKLHWLCFDMCWMVPLATE